MDHPNGSTHRRGARHLVRHLAEMTVAMLVGMMVLGGLFTAGLSVAGVDQDQLEVQAPAAVASIMAFNMTLPMAWWMRRRGHSWSSVVEMSAAMFLPVVGSVPLLVAGVISGETLIGIQHVAMLPAMIAVTLRRRAELAA